MTDAAESILFDAGIFIGALLELLRQLRGIGKSCANIIIGQLRICYPNLRRGHPIRQTAHDHCHRDAGALDTRITVVQIRRYDNPILPRHTAHAGYLPLSWLTRHPAHQPDCTENETMPQGRFA